MTARTRAWRIGTGGVVAAMAMSAFALAAPANAFVPPAGGDVQIRPIPAANPVLPKNSPDTRGFQNVPFIPSNANNQKVSDFQVIVPSRFQAGDTLTVSLPAGVTFAGTPTVTPGAGPTTLTSLETSINGIPTQPVPPIPPGDVPAVTTSSPTASTLAIRFTNNASVLAPGFTDTRFVLNVTEVSVNTAVFAPIAGPLVATITGTNNGGATAARTNAQTTLAFFSNAQISLAPSTVVPGSAAQTIGAITLSETDPTALTNGTYSVLFRQLDNAGNPTFLQIADPSPGGAFNVTVTGSAALGSPATRAVGNTVLRVPVIGLSSVLPLDDPFSINNVRISPPAGNSNPIEVIVVTPSFSTITGAAVNNYTTAAGGVRSGAAADVLGRAADKLGAVNANIPISALPPTGRIAGNDRYETAAAVSAAMGATNTFVVASGEADTQGVDALASNYLAGALATNTGRSVPVLLTRQGFLPDATRNAIATANASPVFLNRPAQIFVVGGPGSVSQAVLDQLATAGNGSAFAPNIVTRVSGNDRYETAAAVGNTGATKAPVGTYVSNFGQASNRTAFVGAGLAPSDALSAGPLAYNKRFPVLLTQTGSLPASTSSTLSGLGIKNVIVLGGTGSVSDAVATQLTSAGYNVTREAGADRFGTNRALYEFAEAPVSNAGTPQGGLGMARPTTGYLANGLIFADALAGGPLAGKTGQPLVLTSPAALSPDAQAYLTENRTTISSVIGFGGPASLPQPVLDAANAAAN